MADQADSCGEVLISLPLGILETLEKLICLNSPIQYKLVSLGKLKKYFLDFLCDFTLRIIFCAHSGP